MTNSQTRRLLFNSNKAKYFKSSCNSFDQAQTFNAEG